MRLGRHIADPISHSEALSRCPHRAHLSLAARSAQSSHHCEPRFGQTSQRLHSQSRIFQRRDAPNEKQQRAFAETDSSPSRSLVAGREKSVFHTWRHHGYPLGFHIVKLFQLLLLWPARYHHCVGTINRNLLLLGPLGYLSIRKLFAPSSPSQSVEIDQKRAV